MSPVWHALWLEHPCALKSPGFKSWSRAHSWVASSIPSPWAICLGQPFNYCCYYSFNSLAGGEINVNILKCTNLSWTILTSRHTCEAHTLLWYCSFSPPQRVAPVPPWEFPSLKQSLFGHISPLSGSAHMWTSCKRSRSEFGVAWPLFSAQCL